MGFEYGQVEHQANVFAANLLMPLDDYRRQIDARTKVDLNMLSHVANRYDVSLIAAILRWLQYTALGLSLSSLVTDLFSGLARAMPPLRPELFFGPPKVRSKCHQLSSGQERSIG